MEAAESSVLPPGAPVSKRAVAKSHMPSMFQRPTLASAFTTVKRRSSSVSQVGQSCGQSSAWPARSERKPYPFRPNKLCECEVKGPSSCSRTDTRSFAAACEVANDKYTRRDLLLHRHLNHLYALTHSGRCVAIYFLCYGHCEGRWLQGSVGIDTEKEAAA